ncbi:hypothetical protein KEM55_003792, partial [Ascosphaera atra]
EKEEAREKQAEAQVARGLELRLEEAPATKREADSRCDALEKKLATLGDMQRDAETRQQARQREHMGLEREGTLLKKLLAVIEGPNLRLGEGRLMVRKQEKGGGSINDEATLNDLEGEEHQGLERHVRELEGVLPDLCGDAWREKRIESQGRMSGQHEWEEELDTFDDVELIASSTLPREHGRDQQQQRQRKQFSLSTALTAGLARFTGPPVPQMQGHEDGKDELLEEDGFDGTAFVRAQAEGEMRKRIEMTKVVKRKLRNWKGWRLDLVDARLGAQDARVGLGEIFEI